MTPDGTIDGGIYFALMRMTKDSLHLKFFDEEFTQTTFTEALTDNYGGNAISPQGRSMSAYMLYYSRVQGWMIFM